MSPEERWNILRTREGCSTEFFTIVHGPETHGSIEVVPLAALQTVSARVQELEGERDEALARLEEVKERERSFWIGYPPDHLPRDLAAELQAAKAALDEKDGDPIWRFYADKAIAPIQRRAVSWESHLRDVLDNWQGARDADEYPEFTQAIRRAKAALAHTSPPSEERS